MTENEVKKYLLKQKPEATFMYIRHGHAYYQTKIELGVAMDEIIGFSRIMEQIVFKISVDDMGSTDFLPTMPGQSLIRWLYLSEN